jgi:hypothetical protein
MLLNDLNTLTSLTSEEKDEAANEFGCNVVYTAGSAYLVCDSLAALAQMSFNLDIAGSIVEYTAIYDSKEEVTETQLA